MASKLTARQQRFVQEYLIDFNATRAAIAAGYSPKYAGQNADKLLKNTNIQAEIQRQGQKTAQKLEISREWVLQRLAAIASAELTDYLSVTTEKATQLGIHPLTGEVINVPGGYCQTVRITDTDKLPAGKAAALASIKQGTNGIEVKLHDSVRALELLGKATGAFDIREAPAETTNNLFAVIIESAREELETDDIQEIEQTPAAGTDVVEPPGLSTP